MEKGKILIVEDSSISALDIKKTLEDLGYGVLNILSKGEDVIEWLKENKPNLILMDIRLKGEMDGIDTAKNVISKYDIPIIFLTGNSDHKTVESIKSINTYGYIVKPYDKNQLFYNIELALYKHKYEIEIKKERKRLETLFLNTPDAASFTDSPSLTIKDINESFVKMFGYTREECIGKDTNELIIPEGLINEAGNIDDKITEGKSVTIETKRKTKSGKLLDVVLKVIPVSTNPEDFASYALYTDITERKKYESELTALYEELQASEEELRVQYETISEREKAFYTLFTNVNDAVVYLSKDQEIIDINESFTKVFGYNLDECKGKNINKLLVPGDKIKEVKTFDEKASIDKTFGIKTIRKTKEGRIIKVFLKSVAITDRFFERGGYAIYKALDED